MNIDIKDVNSIILVIIIVFVIYCLMRKELFTTSVANTTSVCSEKTNKNKTYHPNGNNNGNNNHNPNNCMYVGKGKYSCKVTDVPVAANSGDEELQ
jgi:hypothetical protein